MDMCVRMWPEMCVDMPSTCVITVLDAAGIGVGGTFFSFELRASEATIVIVTLLLKFKRRCPWFRISTVD